MNMKSSSISGTPYGRMLLLFGIEGIFLQYATSINNFSNNLYATNMGATDSQIGMILMIPNLVACIALLPIGILADRLKSSKTVPLATLLVMSAAYFALGTVPALGEARMSLFFAFLAFTVGGLSVYNAQWQAFFGDVASQEQRNGVYALRNQCMFVIGILAPLACGFLMGRQPDTEGKLLVQRIFYYSVGAAMLLQALTVWRIPGGTRSRETLDALAAKRFSPKDIGTALHDIAHDRKFLAFFFPMLLFYFSWHFDWSMTYIGEIQYFNMTETDISVYSAVFSIGQLIAIGIMAKVVDRKGVDFTMIIAIFALFTCPITMMVVPLFPAHLRPAAFTVLLSVLDAPQCGVNLCAVQMLLRAVPEKNRSLIISLYTMVITLSNSFLPFLGVRLYEAFGSTLSSFYLFNVVTLVLRSAALIVFTLKYLRLRRTAA